MADKKSVELLSSAFGSKRFLLSNVQLRYTTAFTRILTEYLEPEVKTERCTYYINYIGVAAYTALEMIENLDFIFKQFYVYTNVQKVIGRWKLDRNFKEDYLDSRSSHHRKTDHEVIKKPTITSYRPNVTMLFKICKLSEAVPP